MHSVASDDNINATIILLTIKLKRIANKQESKLNIIEGVEK